ncbi:MAG: hypothetical protein RLZZ74_1217, partial [Cyanobacteriota bacterium]
MQNWLLQNLSDVLNRELELQIGAAPVASPSHVEQTRTKKPQKYYQHYSQKHH